MSAKQIYKKKHPEFPDVLANINTVYRVINPFLHVDVEAVPFAGQSKEDHLILQSGTGALGGVPGEPETVVNMARRLVETNQLDEEREEQVSLDVRSQRMVSYLTLVENGELTPVNITFGNGSDASGDNRLYTADHAEFKGMTTVRHGYSFPRSDISLSQGPHITLGGGEIYEVAEDKTFTIYDSGVINGEGTLRNKGTIIVGDSGLILNSTLTLTPELIVEGGD
ncbi:hypothetical protein AGMMS49949_05870 [Alphaproteobacteria bacterium]|nr:hypothetical protein AGMMS49949_05870 [Alphaproteobacteria bacterium]GHS99858.1 hypothetical protein AGMMS50296_8100 [Alphaproteobacteria bacterium]